MTTEAAQAKRIERLLDDDLFGDDDLEEKGEDIDEADGEGDFGDDWIVDDEGVMETDEKWGAGRTEVGMLSPQDRADDPVNVTKAQEAFTPGSTSWRAKKRYLGWSSLTDSADARL